MKYKNILITGGAGFIGSNFAISFKKKYPSLKVTALDNLKRRGSELNIARLKERGVDFIHGDIRCPEDLNLRGEFDLLVECSAEPSVLAGYGNNPLYIVNTNLTGTLNCLELARKNKSDVVFLSTSRVYPYQALNRIKYKEGRTRLEWDGAQEVPGWSGAGVDVDFTLDGPKTLYGATKLASEILIQEYAANYGLKFVINRCGVIAGPGQFGKTDQGVFTLWMLAHYFKKGLKYIGFAGKGKQVRDLLHVDDLFRLVDLQAGAMARVNAKTYNVGGGRKVSLSLLEATGLCQKITGNRIKIGKEAKGRPGDVAIYLTDNNKAYSELGWLPKRQPEQLFKDIQAWIRANEKILKRSIL